MPERLVVIDSNSIIHRAFHALPLLTTKNGIKVSALYGFLLVFLKFAKELNPSYIAACFDTAKLTFRHEKFKEYKAKRPPTPEDIKDQIPLVKEFLGKFNVPCFSKEGYEADDLIGTICQFAGPNLEIVILSGDLDNLQLVSPFIKVYFLSMGIKQAVIYDEKKVEERYGLVPSQVIDFKALKGDSSDNIPGVPGIGEKTAIKLLKGHIDLEILYKKIKSKDLKIPESLKKKLLENEEKAFLSRELARIEKNAPIIFELENCRWGKYKKEEIIQLFEKFGFNSLIKRLRETEKETTDKVNLKLW